MSPVEIQKKLMNCEPLNYSLESKIISQSQVIDTNCNGVYIKNLGTDPVTVLGDVLQQGQWLSFGGNLGENLVSNISLAFSGTTSDSRALIITKNYV